MAAPHASQHASGFTRLLGVLALIAGIAAMHVGIFTTPATAAHHTTAAADAFTAVTSHHAAATSGTSADRTPIPDRPADGDRAGDIPATAVDPTAVGTASAPHRPWPGQQPESGRHPMTAAAGSVLTEAPADHPLTQSEFLASPSAEPGCTECGDGHAGLHACVFILTALALAVLLVALYRIPGDQPGDSGGPKARHWRPRRERPPPWTVLSLAELSILRI
ncbi:hypothetical protein [Nocardia sp. bgisy134]|uniref:hypothetical protein n=1 Tax=unclassified Nocardia TaxID=2637762 RepID=UPI003D71011E